MLLGVWSGVVTASVPVLVRMLARPSGNRWHAGVGSSVCSDVSAGVGSGVGSGIGSCVGSGVGEGVGSAVGQ